MRPRKSMQLRRLQGKTSRVTFAPVILVSSAATLISKASSTFIARVLVGRLGRILHACLASLITFGLGATAAPLRLCLGSQPNSPLLLPLLVDWSPRFSQAPRASCLLAACCARFVRRADNSSTRLFRTGGGVERWDKVGARLF